MFKKLDIILLIVVSVVCVNVAVASLDMPDFIVPAKCKNIRQAKCIPGPPTPPYED